MCGRGYILQCYEGVSAQDYCVSDHQILSILKDSKKGETSFQLGMVIAQCDDQALPSSLNPKVCQHTSWSRQVASFGENNLLIEQHIMPTELHGISHWAGCQLLWS